MASKIEYEKKKVAGLQCPEFRAAFVQMAEAKAYEENKPKYSMSMLFDKDTANIKELRRAARWAKVEKWGADESQWPKMKPLFKDGDKKAKKDGYEAFANCIEVACSNLDEPQLIDKDGDDLPNRKAFKSGDYGRAVLIARAYEKAGNRGVAFYVSIVQKTRDGERLGGGPSAREEFGIKKKNDDSENPGNYTDADDSENDRGF